MDNVLFQYAHPDGGFVNDPDEAFLESIFARGEDYWQGVHGCGAAEITYYCNKVDKSSLQMMFKPQCGCYLQFAEKVQSAHGPVWHQYVGLSDITPDPSEWVEMEYGGERRRIPKAFFQSTNVAINALKEFRRTGSVAANVRWVPLKDLKWNRETGDWTPPL